MESDPGWRFPSLGRDLAVILASAFGACVAFGGLVGWWAARKL